MRQVVAKRALTAHPTTPPRAIERVGVKLSRGARGTWLVEFVVTGAIDQLVVPAPSAPERADNLWQTTCFELFVRPGEGDFYTEYNWSPSGRWAAYAFDGYRTAMRDLPEASAPVIEIERTPMRFALEVAIDLSMLPGGDWTLGVSAPIEEIDGTKSFWALAHPSPEPDFHNVRGFTLAV